MGVETAIAAGVGSSLLGAGVQYGEQRAARKRATVATNAASAIAGAPLPPSVINPGQDSLLQMLRSNPNTLKPFQYDASQSFKDLKAQDALDLQDQVNGLSASAGSLGARFGSGFAAKSALLRSRALAATGARNAGISQNSFNSAIGYGLQDQTQRNQLLGLIQQGIFQQRGQQLQALGFGASQPYPSTGQLVSQTGGDIGTLLTLMSYFKNSGAGTPTGAPAGSIPATIPRGSQLPPYYGYPS